MYFPQLLPTTYIPEISQILVLIWYRKGQRCYVEVARWLGFSMQDILLISSIL